MPAEANLKVALGSKVKGGSTVIAEIPAAVLESGALTSAVVA
jgi:hypothetical protein